MKIKTLAMIVVSALSLSSTAALADTTTVNGGTVHFKGEVVNAASCLERDDVGAVIQRGRSTEGGAVQCQWRTGIVEDLHADVGCAASGRVLQGQNGGIAAVDGRTLSLLTFVIDVF